MEEFDARKLDASAQYELRKQVIRGYRRGLNRRQICAAVGLSYDRVCVIVRRYRAAETPSVSVLAPRHRGRKPGEKRRLAPEMEERVQRLIRDRRPEQLKLDFALWSRAAVMELIERECGVKLRVRAVGNYLKRWGFTPQKPIRRAYEQRPEAVKKWLEEEYPAIAARAKAQGGEVHWGDETAVVNTDARGRGYGLRGITPVAYVPGGTRQKLSMISTVTNQGKARWMIVDDAFDADKLIEFMASLIDDTDRKVFLILDNLRVHHSRKVKAWVSDRPDNIEVFYLPSYSPELNPDERLNADLKHVLRTRVPARTKARLKAVTADHMALIECSPDRVMAYFQDPIVRYAA